MAELVGPLARLRFRYGSHPDMDPIRAVLAVDREVKAARDEVSSLPPWSVVADALALMEDARRQLASVELLLQAQAEILAGEVKRTGKD